MIKSVLFGVLVSAVVGIVVFVVAPRTHVVTAYLIPGIAIGGGLSYIIPTKIVYWLDPEGGPRAFLVIVFACAFAFWTLLFGMIHRRHNRKHRGTV
jgi:hypothetical protein